MALLSEYKAHSDSELTVELGALCPACKVEHHFRVAAEFWARDGKDVWTFNWNYERPTFHGSMLANARGLTDNPRCHSFVEDGQWRFLDDCTHELAGKTRPMIPVEPDLTMPMVPAAKP